MITATSLACFEAQECSRVLHHWEWLKQICHQICVHRLYNDAQLFTDLPYHEIGTTPQYPDRCFRRAFRSCSLAAQLN